jgi:hypothetical protein
MAALAGALLAACSASSARAATPVQVTFVGDSIADSLSYVPTAEHVLARGFAVRYDLRVCRRLASTGCPYAGGIPPSALDAIHEDGEQVGQVLVVDVGYNDDPAQYRRGMDDVVQTALALGVRRIVWITLREAQPVYRETNAVIRSEARRFPQVDVADWNAGSAGRPWFRSDGLHLTAEGATALATWLRPYLLRAAAEAQAA